jgi:hypothetical protein
VSGARPGRSRRPHTCAGPGAARSCLARGGAADAADPRLVIRGLTVRVNLAPTPLRSFDLAQDRLRRGFCALTPAGVQLATDWHGLSQIRVNLTPCRLSDFGEAAGGSIWRKAGVTLPILAENWLRGGFWECVISGGWSRAFARCRGVVTFMVNVGPPGASLRVARRWA